jgi:hypothetical protein
MEGQRGGEAQEVADPKTLLTNLSFSLRDFVCKLQITAETILNRLLVKLADEADVDVADGPEWRDVHKKKLGPML